jgi:hypothetical protein
LEKAWTVEMAEAGGAGNQAGKGGFRGEETTLMVSEEALLCLTIVLAVPGLEEAWGLGIAAAAGAGNQAGKGWFRGKETAFPFLDNDSRSGQISQGHFFCFCFFVLFCFSFFFLVKV